MLELERLPAEPATHCFAAEEVDGLWMRLLLRLRKVLPELVRLRDSADERFADAEADGLLEVIVPPILVLVLVVDRLFGEEADGLLIVIDLPIRALLLGLSRILELLPTEVEPFELRLTEIPEEDLLEVEEPGRLETVIRLDVVPFELLLEDVEPERPGVERRTVILRLELLRLGIDRLDEIEPDRLGEDLRTVILRELPRPAEDRLEEVDLERLGFDLLTDILLELLRFGDDRLEVIVLERLELGALLIDVLRELLLRDIDLPELRPADMVLDPLGFGALLTDDLLGLLRLGVGARFGAADFAACADLPELRELDLFRELLATSTESAAKTKKKIKIINRRSHIFNE